MWKVSNIKSRVIPLTSLISIWSVQHRGFWQAIIFWRKCSHLKSSGRSGSVPYLDSGSQMPVSDTKSPISRVITKFHLRVGEAYIHCAWQKCGRNMFTIFPLCLFQRQLIKV